jgi:hypothetical protein
MKDFNLHKNILMNPPDKFESWCLVELFGHQKISGKCTEQNIAGTNMLRVDVPETKKHPAFTRLFGSAAIYAINPIDEQTARIYAESLSVSPILVYNIQEFMKKHQQLQLENKMAEVSIDNDEDDDYDRDYIADF